MPDAAIVTFATTDGDYQRKAERLQASAVAAGFTGACRVWSPDTLPGGCPAHFDSPFAFKPFAIEAARREGHRLVLWMDSACVVRQPLDPWLSTIADRGYLLFANGRWRVGEWISDVALAHLGVSREAAMAMPELNAAVMGFDLTRPEANAFLARWMAEARAAVAFRGSDRPAQSLVQYRDLKWNHRGAASADPRVRGHRHDQSVAGVLAAELGLRIETSGLASAESDAASEAATVVVIDRDFASSRLARVALSSVRRRPGIRRVLRFVRRVLSSH